MFVVYPLPLTYLQFNFQMQINSILRDGNILCTKFESYPLSAIKFAFPTK